MPVELKPTTNRFIITGKPGSGKSTWVAERRQPGDYTWDTDAVAETLFGMPTFPRPRNVLSALDSLFAEFLRQVATLPAGGPQVFIIIANPEKATRLANNLNAQLITIEIDEALRQERMAERAEGAQ